MVPVRLNVNQAIFEPGRSNRRLMASVTQADGGSKRKLAAICGSVRLDELSKQA